ncbi:MAG: hypothetical protein ACRDZ8_14255 [Acidimicrobiales bacterium]
MIGPRGGEDDASSSRLEWATGNLQLLIACASVALLILRVVRVGHGSFEAEQRLITAGSVLSVIFGALAPVIPYLVFVATAALGVSAIKGWRHPVAAVRREAMVSFTLLAVGAILVAFNIPWPMIPYLGAWLLVIWVAARAGYMMIVDHRFNPLAYVRDLRRAHAKVLQTTAIMWLCAGLAFTLIQVGLDDRPWLPAERLMSTRPSASLVGYVLSDDSGQLTVLTDTDRQIVLIDGSTVTRSACHVVRHGRWARFEGKLESYPTIVQLLGWELEPSAGPPCR